MFLMFFKLAGDHISEQVFENFFGFLAVMDPNEYFMTEIQAETRICASIISLFFLSFLSSPPFPEYPVEWVKNPVNY